MQKFPNNKVTNKIQLHNAKRAKLLANPSPRTSQQGTIFKTVTNTAQELVLFFADYECESCGASDDLTIHHLVHRGEKRTMLMSKYFELRHYYKNQVLLCQECHRVAEDRPRGAASNPLDPAFIQSVKEELG